MDEPLEKDRCCGNCKHLKLTATSKNCIVRGLPSKGLSYADCCSKYKFCESEIFKEIEVDKERNCYFYRFILNGKKKKAYAYSLNEMQKMIFNINNIDYFLQTKTTIETIDFLEFMKKEIPDVYRKLRMEYAKINKNMGE